MILSGKLLAVLVNGLADRNAGVRKSYALAIGCLVKVRLLVVACLDKVQLLLTYWLKKIKAEYGSSNTSQSYGVSLAIWDHTVLPATQHK